MRWSQSKIHPLVNRLHPWSGRYHSPWFGKFISHQTVLACFSQELEQAKNLKLCLLKLPDKERKRFWQIQMSQSNMSLNRKDAWPPGPDFTGNFWKASGPPLSFSRKVTKGLSMAPDLRRLRRLPCFSQASLRLELVDDMIVRHHLTWKFKVRSEDSERMKDMKEDRDSTCERRIQNSNQWCPA